MTQALQIAALYLVVINLMTWMSYWHDKRLAVQGQRRVPELRLLALAALGGSPAARGAQCYYRHKTQKQPFRMYLQRIIRWQFRLMVLVAIVVSIMLLQGYMAQGR